MNEMLDFLSKLKDPLMGLVVVSLLYLLITLQRCYNGLLKANIRAVALLQVLVFGKKAMEMEDEE
ncbi:MAG: hypothetical protein NTW48_08970 [Chloroflexi bacterium]|nr:hypothetical protein [Chloroflexota bacterium]